MTVNGEPIHYKLDPQTPLLWALRDASNLTGAKYGCDDGSCGACTVMVDGRAVASCQATIASLEGAEVVTIEGLSGDRSHPVQLAWAAEQVSQCGYCEPGFIMAIAGGAIGFRCAAESFSIRSGGNDEKCCKYRARVCGPERSRT